MKVAFIFLAYKLLTVAIDCSIYSYSVRCGTNYDQLSSYYKWMTPKIYYYIKKNCKQYQIPEELVCSIVQHESGGNQYALSSKGARGYMQVLTVHAWSKDPDILYICEINFQRGAWYLSRCLKKSGGNIQEACRYYNAGLRNKWSDYKNWKYVKRIYRDYTFLISNSEVSPKIILKNDSYFCIFYESESI